MTLLFKFLAVNRRQQFLFCEALILVTFAKIAVSSFPFRQIERFLQRRWAVDVNATNGEVDFTDITVAVSRTTRLVCSKRGCLSRSIALFIMLRRRGIPAVICFGARVVHDSELNAHAWLESGNQIIGYDAESGAFAELLRIGRQDLPGSNGPRNPMMRSVI